MSSKLRGTSPRFLEWAYRKLGRRYPAVFLTVELQTAFVIIAATLGIYTFYYEEVKSDFLLVLAIGLALTALAVGAVLTHIYRQIKPLERWIAGQRDPDSSAEAWRTAVSLPLLLVRQHIPIPILVIVLPVSLAVVLALDLRWEAFFPIFAGGLLAVAYSGTLHYLAVDMAMRPVLVDINNSMEEPPRFDFKVLPLRIKLLGVLPLMNIITGVVVAALSTEGGGASALGVDVLLALAVAFAISFELTVLLSRSIVLPIEELEAATERIRMGKFDRHVPVTSGDELGDLSSAFNEMIDGLAEREQLRQAFGTYLDEEVARHIISEGYDPEGSEREVSIMFVDVNGFTAAAAESSASEVVQRLNRLFEVVVPIISRHHGHVDQFIGDGLMAVFGAPEDMPDHADRAVQCAVEIARTVNSRRPGGFTVGVGVNSGLVVAGSLGGAGRLSFSVIGDAVNLAARVEAQTHESDDDVLITSNTRELLSETMEVIFRGEQALRGYDTPCELYAPLVPEAVAPGAGGEDVGEPLAEPDGTGLGRAPRPGEGLGRRGAPGLGRPSPGSGRSHTLPGR